MRKMKLLLISVFLLFITVKVDARTIEEATQILDSFSTTKISTDVYEWNVPIVDPVLTLSNGQCDYTLESYLTEYPAETSTMADMNDQEKNDYLQENIKSCKENIYKGFFTLYLSDLGYNYSNSEVYASVSGDNIEISVGYDNFQLTRKYHINYETNYDQETFDNIDDLPIKSNYTLYGLNTINSMYHYGDEGDNIKNPEYILYRYPELRNILDNNSEYDIKYVLCGAGGSPWLSGNHAYIGIYKDNILYKIIDSNFGLNFILFVDKDAEGTLFEKAKNRIEDYFENTISVEFNTNNSEYCGPNDCMPNDEINGLLGTSNKTYEGYYTTMTLNGKTQPVLVSEVDKKYLDIVETNASDKNTGVEISTKSYDVPIDATITVENYTNENYVIKALENNNIKIDKAYDINLIKTGESKKITNIKNGVDVYIPVENYEIGDIINVYYIKENSTLGDSLKATIVEKNEKLYAKFNTNHFSTYALEKATNLNENEIENPKTYDSIILNIMLGMTSLVTLLLIFALKYKK